MQIGAARTDLASISALSGTRSASNSLPVAETVQVETPSNPAPPTSASTPLDMDAFFAAWGSDDATWDIDGSGTVDGTDLGEILAAQSSAASGDGALEALLGAWGTADPDWDLNGDGIVNGVDLGMHLNGDGGVGESESMSVDGFASAWGSSDPTYDLNGDGIVDGADLGTYLQQQSTAGVDEDQLTAFMNAWGTSDADFDLNGDGTVDGTDLGLFLNQSGDSGYGREFNSGSERLDQIAHRLAAAAFDAIGGEGLVSIPSGVLGGTMASFDADGDGSVTQTELESAIRNRLDELVKDGTADDDRLQGFVGKWLDWVGKTEIAVDPVGDANRMHGLGRIKANASPIADARATDAATAKVGRVLADLGRDALPPNLPSLLGRISLPGTNVDAVMMQLLAKHPIGGVEATA